MLRLVAQGLTDAQVAEQLVISPRTVNFPLTSIYGKIGVSSRAAQLATRLSIDWSDALLQRVQRVRVRFLRGAKPPNPRAEASSRPY